MKTILIPTDFSDNAADALSYTLDFIGDGQAEIHIINIINPNLIPAEAPEMSVNLLGALIADAKDRMLALEAFSKAKFGPEGKVNIKATVETGTVSEVIKEHAKAQNCDVIIMGTMGESHNLADRILGTISTSTIRNAPCPVILIPQGYKFKTIDNIVFASSLNAGDPFELWRASELLKPHVGIFRCLYVDTKNNQEKYIEEFANYLETNPPSIQSIFETVKSDKIEESIVEYADKHDAEMLVMNRLHNSIWSSLTNQVHTKKILFKINRPLMVMNDSSKS